MKTADEILKEQFGHAYGMLHPFEISRITSAMQAYASEFNKPPPGSVDVEEKEEQVLLPRQLTAENGAKSLLIGEFFETVEVGEDSVQVPVRWTTIKEIYKKIVDHYEIESVKEVSREGEIAELHEKLEEITFYEEEARRQIGIRDQLLEDIFYNRLKPEVIKHKIDQILNLPF